MKEDKEVGKVVFDNIDKEVTKEVIFDNLFIEEVEEEVEHLGILLQVSVGDMMKQTIYDMMRNFIILHIAYAYCTVAICILLIAYSTV